MKASARKKFLLCFQPIVMENRAIKSDSKNFSGCTDFSYISDKNKEKSRISMKNLKSKVPSERESTGRSQKKKTARQILSRMAKAVFFETSLKKVRNGKVVQDPIRSESSLSAKIAKISILPKEKSNRKQSEEEEQWKIKPIVSSSDLSSSSTLTYSSSVSSSSTSSSSCSSSSWPIPESRSSWITFSGRDKSFRLSLFDQKQRNNKTSRSNYCSISGLCLLLFSLSVLIFWGKICAILCTSTWFYFVSTTRREIEDDDDESPVMEKLSEEIQSKEYKKKVIMEGFLERNRRVYNLQ